MSCLSSTAPINIDAEKQSGTCDLKCDYQFNYSSSISTATNRGDYLSLNYEPASSASPVRFNAYDYTVSEVRIYTPSLHTFNGQKTKGECIIVHTSASGNNPLLVCVPILDGRNSGRASQYLSKMIRNVAKTAPVDGETTQIKHSFDLNDFVPSKPFFSYTGTQPYQPCQGKNYFVVFEPETSALGISAKDLEMLTSVINENAYVVNDSTPFFYNKGGASQGMISGDDIYIDCQPVGQSEETTETVSDADNKSSIPDIFQGDWLKYFIICFAFFVLLMAFNNLLNYLGTSLKNFKMKF